MNNDIGQDRDDRFYGARVQMIESACQTCAHRSKILPGACLAFPDGIPEEIALGRNDHSKPYKGDNGIQYLKV